jgi:hypothetical protein
MIHGHREPSPEPLAPAPCAKHQASTTERQATRTKRGAARWRLTATVCPGHTSLDRIVRCALRTPSETPSTSTVLCAEEREETDSGSGSLDARTYEHLNIRTSEHPDIGTSEGLNIWKSGNLDVWKSGRLGLWTSEHLSISTTRRLGVWRERLAGPPSGALGAPGECSQSGWHHKPFGGDVANENESSPHDDLISLQKPLRRFLR